jgi:hypothetical protein
MINWANWLVHKVCDGRQTPKSIIGNVETISLSMSTTIIISAFGPSLLNTCVELYRLYTRHLSNT